MRKTTLKSTLRVFLLFLVTLVTGGGYALAEEHTYEFAGSAKIYSDAELTTEIKTSSTIESAFYAPDGAKFAVTGTVKFNSGYLFPSSNSTVTLPLYKGEKIVSVALTNSGGCSTKVVVAIKSGNNVASAGQTWSKTNSTYIYDIAADYQESELAIETSTKNSQITKIVITTESTGEGGDTQLSAPTLSLAAGTYWKSQALSISVPENAVSVRYTLDGSDPKTSETAVAITEAANITLTKTTTVRAIALDKDGNTSNEATRTYTFVPSIANTQETAYTVEEVKNIIDNTSTEQLKDERVFVKGTVSKVDSYNSTDKFITYWLDENTFEVYKGLGLDSAGFSAKEDVEFGATVIVYGNVKNYKGTYELDKNNFLVSYTAPAPVTLESVAITGEAKTTEYEEGAKFSRSGLALTATYSDETTQDVTTDATWTVAPETLTREVTEVTVTATYKEMTATKVIPVRVLYTDPVEGNSIIMATYEKDDLQQYAAMTTTLNNDIFVSTVLYKVGDKFVTTGKLDNILFATETTNEGTTIQRTEDGKYVQATAAKKMGYTSDKYYWQNKDNTLTAANEAHGVLRYNTNSPRFTTYTSNTGVYATIIDKSMVLEGEELTLTGQEGDNYYATFYSDKAVQFADATVYAVGVEDGRLKLEEVSSKQVPANTGVLIQTTSETTVYAYIESAPAVENNLLRGSIVNAETTAPADGDYNFYMLSLDKDSQNIGFYWGAEGGAAFENKAGHAYLAVPKSTVQSVKGFSITDLETGLSQVEASDSKSGAVYDLQGRRVNRAAHGLYIQNGHVVLVK